MKGISIFLLALLFIAPATHRELAASFSTPPINTVVGNWVLRTTGDIGGGRKINFAMKAGRLGGKYYNSQGQPKGITNVRFNRKSLQFNVPDLQLYFDLWVVGDHFEGKMSTTNPNQKIMAVPVTLSKK